MLFLFPSEDGTNTDLIATCMTTQDHEDHIQQKSLNVYEVSDFAWLLASYIGLSYTRFIVTPTKHN